MVCLQPANPSVDPQSFRINAATISALVVPVAALVLISAVVYMKDITVGGFRWGDAPTHAMDGVLIHDWITAGPSAWFHPIDFAVRQYSYYPTLGIISPYPPGYAMVEAVFFLFFGVSVTVARLCVASFGIAAVIGVYMVAKRHLNTIAAFCAAMSLTAMPAVIHWTRQNMLEMPTLAILIWLIYFVQRYVEKPNWKRWAVVVLFMLAAPMFKQTSAFIIPILGILFLIMLIRKKIPPRQFIAAATIILTPLIILLVTTFWSDSTSTHMLSIVASDKPIGEWLTLDLLMFYPKLLPQSIGWIILVASALGFIFSLKRWNWMSGCLIGWFMVFLMMIFYVTHKQPRYLFFIGFPLAMWVGAFAQQIQIWISSKKTAVSVALLVGLSLMVIRAYDTPVTIYPHYGHMVEKHSDKIRGKVVFFEGRRDGEFIFAVREKLGKQQAVIIRGSKILYSCAADTYWHYESYVSSIEEVHDKLYPFGFESLFVEKDNVAKIAEIDLLHEYLRHSSTYSFVDSFQYDRPSHVGDWQDRTVNVYVPKAPGMRTVRFFDIPIPIAAMHLRVDLDALVTDLPDLQ